MSDMPSPEQPNPYGKPFNYGIPASETPAGKAREAAYYSALGRFVAMFAIVEAAIQYTLWHYAKTSEAVAKSIFSGVKVKTGISFIKRLAEATGVSEGGRKELEDAFTQLNTITDARNEILHHGAQSVASGAAFVTNEFLAHLPDRVTLFPISPDSLDDMTADLSKIILLLHWKHAGRPSPLSKQNERMFEAVLSAPWRYTHLVLRPIPQAVVGKPPSARKPSPKPPRSPSS
jgi:hypothetical protein